MPVVVKSIPSQLTAILERSGAALVAYCPELDIAVESDDEHHALAELADAAKEYADEYSSNFDLYSRSPNRAAHRMFVEAIRQLPPTASVIDLFSSESSLPTAK